MSIEKRLSRRAKTRTFRTRNKQVSRGAKPRVSVFRSAKHIYAQIIDDANHATLASSSTLSVKASGKKSERAKQVGIELGKAASEKAITEVFFDRGKFKYHGRVAALADGLRESGLKF